MNSQCTITNDFETEGLVQNRTGFGDATTSVARVMALSNESDKLRYTERVRPCISSVKISEQYGQEGRRRTKKKKKERRKY